MFANRLIMLNKYLYNTVTERMAENENTAIPNSSDFCCLDY